eukprot:4910660-Alexandrium_andersonii.AAC.1
MDGYLRSHADRLFKGKTPEYRTALQRRADFPVSVRCKINTAGPRACRFWSWGHERMEPPADLHECGLVP